MSDKQKVVPEHYQIHSITEVEHFPEHDQRKESLEFRNAKHELEIIEHIGCNVCGTMEKRESHHIVERAYANGMDFRKVAHLLWNHRDYHGHCKRDFKSPDELYTYLQKIADDEGADHALDTLYNQEILCALHHRGMGHGRHGTTSPTFDAIMCAKDGFDVSISLEEYHAKTLNKGQQ